MRKIKWLNVIKAIIFIACLTLLIHDLYMLTIYTWITGKLVGLTWFGLITFILNITILFAIYDDFAEQTKSAANIDTVTRTNILSQKYINSIPQNKDKR